MRCYENEHYAVLGRRFERLAREIGGETEDGIRLLEGLAKAMKDAHEDAPARGTYEALGRVHEAYGWLVDEAVEKSLDDGRQKNLAMSLIVEAARFWLGEHDHA